MADAPLGRCHAGGCRACDGDSRLWCANRNGRLRADGDRDAGTRDGICAPPAASGPDDIDACDNSLSLRSVQRGSHRHDFVLSNDSPPTRDGDAHRKCAHVHDLCQPGCVLRRLCLCDAVLVLPHELSD